jgi:hypothetical protein
LKKILIISPHYPPSNLAAVHRSRLFAQHLPAYGWEPIILTVHEDFYEEALDRNLEQLLPQGQRIEKVNAYGVTRPRIIGDIGLRAFYQLRKKALELVKKEGINFVYIPIPSFYVSLIGPYLFRKTGVKYGIDYIDPWVHIFPGSDKLFSRHWFSTKIAAILEPYAVKYASLITGVSEGYYQGVKDRNQHLVEHCIFGAMPYGGEKTDHEAVKRLNLKSYLFRKNGKLQMVYAGAMLPKAYVLLDQIFRAIAENKSVFKEVEFHFIGTGYKTTDANSYTIRPLAEKYNLWDKVVFEYPLRIPYLDVLVHLDAADGIFILGSTEPHYTPSKTYQGVLSGKPIFAVLNKNSTAVEIIENTNAGHVLQFNESTINTVYDKWVETWNKYYQFYQYFDVSKVSLSVFRGYSASNVTQNLIKLLNIIQT